MRAKLQAETEKLRAFWSKQGSLMRSTVERTPFIRLHGNIGGKSDKSDIRQLHNRFGWQAGEGRLCAGTLYRSEKFINLADHDRCATKALGQTVHLEHTVPVAALARRIAGYERVTPDDTIAWLLGHSITAAVTDGINCERRKMVQKGQAWTTHSLVGGHPDEGLPFRRYNPKEHSPIWDLVKGLPIDPDSFTFADHRANIATVLGWAGLDDWAERVSAIE
ncbi:MAG TPA: hypothetical protein VNS79_13970 [Sphingobium sp.]|nr:hypothetical protein [Sphingobium sp.]